MAFSATPTEIEANPLASPEHRSIVEILAAKLTARRAGAGSAGSEPSRGQNGSGGTAALREADGQTGGRGEQIVELKGRRAGRQAPR
jgi:hypothetical protein